MRWRGLVIGGLLMAGMVVSRPLLAQTNSEEMAQLKQRVAQLEKQVQEMSQVIEPLRASLAAESRRKAFRERFEKKMVQDQTKYSTEQLGEAERLYQVANQKWGSAEASESLQTMIKKYPDINRTGCALLYVAQQSSGEERTRYLEQCIERHNDCFYGDGVQVGAYARFLLAEDYKGKGEREKAATLYKEIQANYADAVDHGGRLLVESMKVESR